MDLRDGNDDGPETPATDAEATAKAVSGGTTANQEGDAPAKPPDDARGRPPAGGTRGKGRIAGLVSRSGARFRGMASRLRAKLPRTRRGRIIFYTLVAVLGLSFAGGMSVAVWSSFPSFCRSCHHITPYYESWKTSVHGREHVACTDCHFKPGTWPYLKGKMNGMVEVFKYFSHAYGPKLRSEVQDVSCLRAGCHAREELDKELAKKAGGFKGTRFAHEKHFEPLRAGIELRCASCHSQSLHTEKGTVSTGMCFSCHLAPGGEGGTPEEVAARKRAAACETCHDVPKEVVTGGGFKFDHGKYASKGSDCASCHSHVTHGEGRVAARQCELCHNEGTAAEREEFAKRGPEGVAEIHATHVHETQVECFECHDEMLHGPAARAIAAAQSCDACHDTSHAAIRALYEGSGGAVRGEADPMAASGVRCQGCHKGEKRGALASAVCTPCHEKEYDNLGGRWKSAFEIYVTRLDAAAAKAGALEPGPEARAFLDSAARDIAFVRDGRGVHNVKLAVARLHAAQEGLARLLGGPGALEILPLHEKEAARCLERCHVGVETTGHLRYAGKDMPHGPHVASAKVACAECHDMTPEKHKTTLADVAKNCGACHHKAAATGDGDCASCHPRQDVAYRGTLAGLSKPRPSDMAKGGVKCLECHAGIATAHSREGIKEACAACHKVKAFGRMLDEWQAGTREAAAELDALVERAKEILVKGALPKRREAVLRAARERAVGALELFRTDGSVGAHNLGHFDEAFSAAAEGLRSALE